MSYVDAQYMIAQFESADTVVPVWLGVYRDNLGQTLGTRCAWLPSDSHYAVLMNRKCGTITTLVHSAARILLEPSAAKLQFPVTSFQPYIRFWDPPDACE